MSKVINIEFDYLDKVYVITNGHIEPGTIADFRVRTDMGRADKPIILYNIRSMNGRYFKEVIKENVFSNFEEAKGTFLSRTESDSKSEIERVKGMTDE